MKITGLFSLVGAAIIGIYLTSDEGKLARIALDKKKSSLKPIITDLLAQANEVINGTKKLNSDEIRTNIELLINETKESLVNLDLEKTIDTIKQAIKISSKKINIAYNEVEKEKRIQKKSSRKTIISKNKKMVLKTKLNKK